MIWFHGNAGNIGNRVDNIKRLHDKTRIGIFIFDYRSYGRSPAARGNDNLIRRRSGDEFRPRAIASGEQKSRDLRLPPSAAGPAEMASGDSRRAVILESPFASIRAMAKLMLPALPISRLLVAKFDVTDKVGKITAPLLLLLGDRDEIVPFEQSQRVLAAARPTRQFYPIKGTSHNDTLITGGDG